VTKQTALGDSFFVGQYDLSGDVGSVQAINASRAVIDVSAINVNGMERLLGRADGQITFGAFYNPSAGQSHPALSGLLAAAGTVSTMVSLFEGAAIGNTAHSMEVAQVTYNQAIGADLSIALSIDAQSSKGHAIEYGVMLTTGKQTIAAAGTATSVDGGAATSFGWAAYLHVVSIASGTATVTIQDSADNSSFAPFTSSAFTAVSGPTYERIAGTATATVRRYRWVVFSGTFTNLVCAVNLVVFPTSQT